MHEFDSHHPSPLTLFILRAELLKPTSFVIRIHKKILCKGYRRKCAIQIKRNYDIKIFEKDTQQNFMKSIQKKMCNTAKKKV